MTSAQTTAAVDQQAAELEVEQKRAARVESRLEQETQRATNKQNQADQWFRRVGTVEAERDEAWRQAAAWRESSAMFEARSQQLEAALAAIQQQGNGNTGAAFLGGLLGFSAGVALSEYNNS